MDDAEYGSFLASEVKTSTGMNIYRGWKVSLDPPPIPDRSMDWSAYGPNYEAWTQDGSWQDNGEKAFAPTYQALTAEIDAWYEENE